ncbi:MAG: hydroxyacid dehydrogenase [Anaerolineaceae bacterium]
MPRPTVIVCTSAYYFEHFLAPCLEDTAWDFDLLRVDPQLGVEHLLSEINRSGAAVLVTGWDTPPLPASLRQQATGLNYICHLIGTIRHLVPRSLIEGGLTVTNYNGAMARIVAEHCLLQILACLRQAAHYQISLHTQGGWSQPAAHPPRSLYGRRVGLHGFGFNARALVRLLEPFGCQVAAYAPGDPDELLTQMNVTRCNSLEELFSGSQILVEFAPLIPETEGVVNERLLRLLPEDGILVNCGRGAVLDQAALTRLAQEGKLTLGLDVFVEEPLPLDSPLRSLPNVFLTPHIAGPTLDHYADLGWFALRNVARYFKGEPLQAVIDGYRYDHQT